VVATPVTDAMTSLSGFTRTDSDIREEVAADVALSAPAADATDVAVQDGIVTLTGFPID
jgi:osmotically-inducible protein OsmY